MFPTSKQKKPHTTIYHLESGKLPRAFHQTRIALLSDLHAAQFGKGNEELIRAVKRQEPDYVMMAGDMVVWNLKDVDTPYRLASELAKDYPVYYAIGNHERKAAINPKTRRKYFNYKKSLRQEGVVFLGNQSTDIERGGSRIRVSGLNLTMKYYKKFWEDVSLSLPRMERRLGPADKENYQILIAHHPDYFPVYAKWGADLTLSGHVHGGIAVLPLLGGVIAPSYECFPKYDYGVFKEGEARMVLSRGLGAHTIPLRVFNPPELVVVELLSKTT